MHIGTNPDATVAYVGSNDAAAPVQKARAAAARRLLSSSLGPNGAAMDWGALVKRNKRIPTLLEPLGVARVADLMQHACVLAAVQCHVFLDYPLPPENEWKAAFGRARFEALARGELA